MHLGTFSWMWWMLGIISGRWMTKGSITNNHSASSSTPSPSLSPSARRYISLVYRQYIIYHIYISSYVLLNEQHSRVTKLGSQKLVLASAWGVHARPVLPWHSILCVKPIQCFGHVNVTFVWEPAHHCTRQACWEAKVKKGRKSVICRCLFVSDIRHLGAGGRVCARVLNAKKSSSLWGK